jgi:hypothetical protein
MGSACSISKRRTPARCTACPPRARRARAPEEPGLREELSGRGLLRARELSWDRSAEAHLEAYRAAAEEGPIQKN